MTLEEIYNYLEKHKNKIGQIRLSKLQENYFQISLIHNNRPYKLSDIHFEVRFKNENEFSLEIHFEEEDTTRYKSNFDLNTIVKNSDFEWFQWWTGKKVKRNANNQSLKSKKSYLVDGEKSLEDFFSVIKKEHDRFNSTLVQIAKEKQKYTMDKGKNNQMLSIKNIILYGSPGVGKTHNTNKLISLIESGMYSEKEIFEAIKENTRQTIELDEDIKSRTKFVTFHQSFGYEDFIEGFRPNEEGNIELVDGIFKNICKDAEDNILRNGSFGGLHQPSLDDSLVKQHEAKSEKIERKNYYLVIDEINRGNISKIFGELITLIEEDKRDKLEATLPYSKQPFKIPLNLYIIGTMNSSDKSIALIDIALRRRFTFLKMEPNADLIEKSAEAKALFIALNEHIRNSHLGEDYQIGHSYFMGIESSDDLDFVWEYKIKPLLEEYFYGDKEGLDEVLKLKS